MTTFASAVSNQEARTTNGMKARLSTSSATVDLFYKIGASRGKDIIPDFVAAYVENREHALRIAQWARDARSGAGERQIFRNILNYLEINDPDAAMALARKVPELGRWDDLLVFNTPILKVAAFRMIEEALEAKNGLCAKWMPRQGAKAAELRNFLNLTPKAYRKRLVSLTKVVETQMCSNDWDNINFNQVPSVAAARYKKAFQKHTPKFAEYVAKLASGDTSVKVNAGAVYPYDILKTVITRGWGTKAMTKTERDHIIAQWAALPNYVGDANVLPIVDVSGSMACPAGSNSNLTCLDVAVSLGLYFADKNTGKFKDIFLTFSTNPELVSLKGDIIQKVEQMSKSNWSMSTNLHAALDKLLNVAVSGKVPQEEMPRMLLIMSDMQFNQCVTFDDSAIQMLRRKYTDAGYTMPQVVFWNINAYKNAPVSMDERGVALVSGYSPSIAKTVIEADPQNFTPDGICLKTIMNPRYDI